MPAETAAMQPATFGRRAAAFVIDCLVASAVALAFTFPRAPEVWSAFALLTSYTGFAGLFGQTPGMRALGIACLSVRTGGPIGVPRALLRALLLQLVFPALFMDSEGRGWHDRAVGSIMVRVREGA